MAGRVQIRGNGQEGDVGLGQFKQIGQLESLPSATIGANE